MEFYPIPEPVFDVNAWFKSTFNFDGHGNIIINNTHKGYYYQLDRIIKKIGNSQSENVLKYLKNFIHSCTHKHIPIAQCYEFRKINQKTGDECVSVSESDFNRFASRGLWHDNFKENRKNGSEYAYLYLAWENECLRKKVEELDNTMKIIINMGLINDNSSGKKSETKPDQESDQEPKMICFCKKIVLKKCVEANTPNKGKYYLSCATRSCKFFTWSPNNLII